MRKTTNLPMLMEIFHKLCHIYIVTSSPFHLVFDESIKTEADYILFCIFQSHLQKIEAFCEGEGIPKWKIRQHTGMY